MQRRSKDVSVIVPLTKSRIEFFQGFTLPSIEANQPKEIIIIDDDAPATIKRNMGAEKATGKYLYFCDDDAVLSATCLETLASYLETKEDCSFAYCNFTLVNLSVEMTGTLNNVFFTSVPWDPVLLREINYVDTGSLIKQEDFMGFDESMPRFQDWEMWLRMAKAGKKGLYVPHNLYFTFKIGKSISSEVPKELAIKLIDEKHPPLEWPFTEVPRNERV